VGLYEIVRMVIEEEATAPWRKQGARTASGAIVATPEAQ
jgi:hypothetical protein